MVAFFIVRTWLRSSSEVIGTGVQSVVEILPMFHWLARVLNISTLYPMRKRYLGDLALSA